MPAHSELDTRMKQNYEMRSRSYLTRRTPVIIRIDGKAFHTFSRGFKEPYDKILMLSMQDTMKYLCEHIQGCVLGYTQSDEISLLLVDYKGLNSESWFDYRIQKMCSIAASMATMEFNRTIGRRLIYVDPMVWCEYTKFNNKEEFIEADYEDLYNDLEEYELLDLVFNDKPKMKKLQKAYSKAATMGALFDARCFNIPPEEVTNYFFSRQIDAIRNSVQMAGQAQFSSKQLHLKSQNDIKNMLYEEKGIDWENYCTDFKRGSCCIKVEEKVLNKSMVSEEPPMIIRHKWKIDHEIPVFKGEGRNYIEKLI